MKRVFHSLQRFIFFSCRPLFFFLKLQMVEQYLPDKWPMERLRMVSMKQHRVVCVNELLVNLVHNWIHQQALMVAHKGYGGLEIDVFGVPDFIMDRIIRTYITQQYTMARDKDRGKFQIQWASELPLAEIPAPTQPGRRGTVAELQEEADWVLLDKTVLLDSDKTTLLWTRFTPLSFLQPKLTTEVQTLTAGLLPPAVQQGLDEFLEQLTKPPVEEVVTQNVVTQSVAAQEVAAQNVAANETVEEKKPAIEIPQMLTNLLTSRYSVYCLKTKQTRGFQPSEYLR